MGSSPAQIDVLSESERTRVVRLHLPDGRSAIRKEPLGPDRRDRVSHEVEILRRLAGVRHVVPLLPNQPDPGSILLEDVHGTPLSGVAMPPDTPHMVTIMLGMARAVAAVHQHGIVHCDISPRNILLADDEDAPYLIDFALAITFAELRPEFTHHMDVVGTLPYLAPEQTGRTARSVDRRSDLYGLGATMYQLATGQPPFGTGDPLRLIHDHLARAPIRPIALNPALPPAISQVVMHLLEKEPDNRYQSAEGLVRDLERVRDGTGPLRLGEDDVPVRLTAPSRLVGRDGELDVLRAAFEAALAGESRAVVISGESGVGKTALIDELRPIVTGGDGWYVSGKFDRHRRDPEYNGTVRAMRGLGRLLLAEPEDALGEIRQRLLQELGPNAGMAALMPEFSALLKVPPDPGDQLTAQIRARRTAIAILRAVASQKRPVVYVVDDVQWAGSTPLGLLDLLVSGDEQIEGLLTVVAYREGAVRDADPLAPLLARWQRHPTRPEFVRVTNLNRRELGTMVAEMLHSPAEPMEGLVDALYGRTGGNPYETIELINGLRREGVLRPAGPVWQWDPAALERRLAHEDVTQLTQARVNATPGPTREMLEAMACLGGEVQLRALEVATGVHMNTIERRLAPALDDGLLVMVAGAQAARFQHDQLRDVVLSAIPPQQLRGLRLRMARRLAARPDLNAVAADQYLPVIDDVHDPRERSRTANLLRRAADQNMQMGESSQAAKMLGAAVQLIDDPERLIELHTLRHAALFRLGQLAEADEVYQAILELSTEPYDRVDATGVQISSLTNRNRPVEAIALGLDMLRELGWDVPSPDEVEKDIDREIEWCSHWIDGTSEQDDLRRPDVTDSAVLAAGGLISRMLPACFFRDQVTMAWLALAAARIWAARGPARTLAGAVGHVPWVLVGRRRAYRAGYRLVRRLIRVGEERGFEPFLSQTRFLYALGLCHWFNPLEEEAAEARQAREGLIRGGDLQFAAYTYSTPLYAMDPFTTVDEYAAQVNSALAFSTRTGNQHALGVYQPYQWLVAALRGEPAAGDWSEMADRLTEPLAAANLNVARALAAAIFDDPGALFRHSMAAMSLRAGIEATYAVWQAHVVRAIALADRIRGAPDVAAEMTELDDIVNWIAQRAADMPTNFGHMLNLIEAERAWAVGDFGTAIHAFDTALRRAGHRPWHRAYIAERSAKFMLAHGLDHAGWSLLVEAREAYRVWGARAKVQQLDRAYPSLDIPTEPSAATRRSSITAGAIDMVGILDASRAISSETSVGPLRAKVVEVLSAMTGATDVGLLLWTAEQRRWLAARDDEPDPSQFGRPHRVPQSIVRYVERTQEPLIIGDATRDDRFARDPYFADLTACSVLAVPVLGRAGLQAILLLENRLLRDAFPVERLEAVNLIAGQLGVSLDNALMYASLERKVSERTQQLALANERLEQLSITDPLTGLANRRRLEESLRNEWARARRTGAPLSLAMVDIDHFKRYNDVHGHSAGDRCLQRVAAGIDRSVRDIDLVARYGGEEFVVIMPDTGSAAGWDAAERVRVSIAELAEHLTDEEVVTASVGVATLHDAEQLTTDQLIERADGALYLAKRTGRNRVCLAAPDGRAPSAPS